MYLACMDIDYAIRKDEPQVITTTSSLDGVKLFEN